MDFAFWWGKTGDQRGMHWLSWNKLCQPKGLGGLGFRSLIEFNQALVAKQCWRLIQHPTSLVSRVLKSCYYPSSSLIDAKLGRNPSFLWRSLCWGCEVLRRGCIWRVGNGQHIRIYEDPWLAHRGSLRVLSPRSILGPSMVSDLLTDSGSWNEPLVCSVFSADEASLILNTHVGGTNKIDRLAWHYQSSGKYSVKSGYQVAWKFGAGSFLGSTSGEEANGWWKSLWQLQVPTKVKLFLWRACKNALPCLEILSLKRISPDSSCMFCQQGPESILHAIWVCPNVRRIWKEWDFYHHLKNTTFASPTDLIFWALHKLSIIERDRFALTAWTLWNRRNALLHGIPTKPERGLLHGIIQLNLDFYEAQQAGRITCSVSEGAEGKPKWTKPREGQFKINVDGGIGDGCVGIGVIIRNHDGAVMAALAKPIPHEWSPLTIELLAIKEAIHFCLQTGFTNGDIVSDCQLAIKLIEHGDFCLESNCFLIDDIRILLAASAFTCSFVRREANIVAHQLAKYALSLDSFETWLEEEPVWLSSFVQDDICNAVCV